jgi:mono/diheme cytochrome c family protein
VVAREAGILLGFLAVENVGPRAPRDAMNRNHASHALVLTAATAAAALLVAACEKKKQPEQEHETTGATIPAPETVPITAAARKEAAELFASRCVACHGPTGEGNGPASGGLSPKPRNFHDATWQASVANAHLDRIIQYGGAAVGKSPAMPPNPDMAGKPEVVAALREHIRSLKSQ